MILKIVIWLVAAVVFWYLIREALISLDKYIASTNFGKVKIKQNARKKFKFSTDPLAPR